MYVKSYHKVFFKVKFTRQKTGSLYSYDMSNNVNKYSSHVNQYVNIRKNASQYRFRILEAICKKESLWDEIGLYETARTSLLENA